MTPEEKTQMSGMQNDIKEIKEQFSDMREKVDKMYYALIGNELAQDGGLVQRIKDNEIEVVKMQKQIDALVKRHDRNALYLKIIWTMVGTIGTGACIGLFNLLSKLFLKK